MDWTIEKDNEGDSYVVCVDHWTGIPFVLRISIHDNAYSEVMAQIIAKALNENMPEKYKPQEPQDYSWGV